MNCAINDCRHEDQRTRFPVGAEVKTLIPIEHGAHRGQLPVGTKGVVTGHCDDGRAWVLFDGYFEGHTFHEVDEFLKVVSLPVESITTLVEQRDLLAAALRFLLKDYEQTYHDLTDGQFEFDGTAIKQAQRALATVEQGGKTR